MLRKQAVILMLEHQIKKFEFALKFQVSLEQGSKVHKLSILSTFEVKNFLPLRSVVKTKIVKRSSRSLKFLNFKRT